MVGRGVYKGPLSLDVIMVLSLEVTTQLEEEGPHQSAPDPLDEINKAGRAPLIQILERISDLLLRMIAMGSPSLKRYLFLSAYLSQIRAIESGQPVKQAVYEAVVGGMKKCRSLLQAQAQRLGSSGGGDVGMSVGDAAAAPFYQLDMDSVVCVFRSITISPKTGKERKLMPASQNTEAPWDISYLLDLPVTDKDGQNAWVM